MGRGGAGMKDMTGQKYGRFTVVTSSAELEMVRESVRRAEFIAFDIETTGVTATSEVIGFALCADLEHAFYVALAYWDTRCAELRYFDTREAARDLLKELVGKKLIMHNGVFDCSMVWNNFKISLIEDLHTDTLVLAHLLDENRRVGLKDLGAVLYGESAREEQIAMRESVTRNGGLLTKKAYELYKADYPLIGEYACRDVWLTMSLFYDLLPQLDDEGMVDFFFNDESMPLLRTATYQLNTEGLKVDVEKLQKLKRELEIEAAELCALIDREITPHVKDRYPGTNKRNTFNIDSRVQLSWLLHEKLNEQFVKVSNAGADLCRSDLINLRRPYSNPAKREFIRAVTDNKGKVWRTKGTWDWKKKKFLGEAKVRDYWTYLSTDRTTLQTFAKKYKWVEALLKLRKVDKIRGTYVEAILERHEYGIIRPSFLQHGTTSGRYSSKSPNFQNIPRDDKRVKACIVSRPGKVFVGADMSQLEPRVFASISQDKALMGCFASGEDFYSVVGAPIFGKTGCSLFKDDPNSFAKKYPQLRDRSKVIALATPYGRTAAQQASAMGISVEESQDLIDRYFAAYPSVEKMMLESHEMVKARGYVENLFGRKRRIPEAREIKKKYGDLPHNELPYQARNLLNLAMNARVQSTGASIMNRAAIAFCAVCKELAQEDPAWAEVKIVLQVHDQLIAESPEHLAEQVVEVMRETMEHSVELPGVQLIADPIISKDLSGQK